MFKKGDVVQSIRSLIIYECIEDTDKDGRVRCACIDISLNCDSTQYPMKIGDKTTFPISSLRMWKGIAAAITDDVIVNEPEPDPHGLIAQRRALKSFLGG